MAHATTDGATRATTREFVRMTSVDIACEEAALRQLSSTWTATR